MNPLSIKSGWWVSTDDHFVCCYNSKEEAINHVKYQKEKMHSKANWYVQYIKINFGEYLRFPYLLVDDAKLSEIVSENTEAPSTEEFFEDVD